MSTDTDSNSEDGGAAHASKRAKTERKIIVKISRRGATCNHCGMGIDKHEIRMGCVKVKGELCGGNSP